MTLSNLSIYAILSRVHGYTGTLIPNPGQLVAKPTVSNGIKGEEEVHPTVMRPTLLQSPFL